MAKERTLSDDERRAPTIPDELKAVNVKETRTDIKVLTGMQRRTEIQQRITASSTLDAEGLTELSRHEGGRKILFIEYLYQGLPFTFVYIDKDHTNPTHVVPGPERSKMPLVHPGATVLLRVSADGSYDELYRWEDEE